VPWRRVALCNLCTLCVLGVRAGAHDLERTRVALTLSRDGSFVLDVSNDPAWLKLRLESIPGPFVDRVVLFVDGQEVRPASDEYVADEVLGTHRLRGQLPHDARTLRWYYGLVIDPYPLTIRFPDGRIRNEVIAGDAWSGTIDIAGQFRRPAQWPIVLVAALLASGVVLRLLGRMNTKDTKDTRNELV